MKKKLDYAKDPEAVEQNHDFHCRVHDISFWRRTIYTCNCQAEARFKKEFKERRKPDARAKYKNAPVKYPLIIKGRTNGGELAKQRVMVMKGNPEAASLLIMKYVLVPEADEGYKEDFVALKSFKGMVLYRQAFAIKLSTLAEIVNWLNSLVK